MELNRTLLNYPWPRIAFILHETGVIKHSEHWLRPFCLWGWQFWIAVNSIAVNALFKHQSQSHFTRNGPSVCLSQCRAPSEPRHQISVFVSRFSVSSLWGDLSDERTSVPCRFQGQLHVLHVYITYGQLLVKGLSHCQTRIYKYKYIISAILHSCIIHISSFDIYDHTTPEIRNNKFRIEVHC